MFEHGYHNKVNSNFIVMSQKLTKSTLECFTTVKLFSKKLFLKQNQHHLVEFVVPRVIKTAFFYSTAFVLC